MKNKALFLSLYSMVLADGYVHAKELETLYKLGRDNFMLTEKEINETLVTAGIARIIPDSLEEKIWVLYNLAVIAWADGEVSNSEKDLLRRYVVLYKFEDENADSIVDFLIQRAQKNNTFETVLSEITNA